MPYFAIFTTLGLQRLAEAQASYTPLEFTELAVGDGDGEPITPSADMTALVREQARVSVNLVEVDPENPNQVRVEGIIPAGTGGFTIREAGIFNAAGELIAVASYPPIEKPVPADGVTVQEYIRILLVYENPAEAIAVEVDTEVAVATRLYVDDEIAEVVEYIDAEVEAAQLGNDIIIADDFTGEALDDSKWIDEDDAGVTIVADTANGGSGAVQLASNNGGGIDEPEIRTHPLLIGTGDFDIRVRVRVPTFGNASEVRVGFDEAVTAAERVLFKAVRNVSVNWFCVHGNTTTDTGVAVSSAYQLLRIRRRSGVLYFYINGTLEHQLAFTADLDEAGVRIAVEYVTADSTMLVDYVKLRAARE